MKLALTICEYNPFHNGHLYSINKIKEELNPDLVCVIMSGNFTERGEVAILNKFDRATHAVYAGADVVFELPTVFATATAEIFARGAIKLLSDLSGEKTLCFGVESGTKSALITTATALSSESKEFKQLLKSELDKGYSFACARQNALEKLNLENVDLNFTKTPNNILALEYAKAIIEGDYKIDLLPILRQGAGYKDKTFTNDSASAMAIRKAIEENNVKSIKNFVPNFVFEDLPDKLPDVSALTLYALNAIDKKQLKNVLDCTEGLENRIKAYLKDCLTLDELIQKLTTKRYTSARLRRIALSALLNVDEKFIRECLKTDLYLKVLAINKNSLEKISQIKGNLPLIMRKSDVANLSKTALKCFEKDVFANDIYSVLTNNKTNEYYTKIV